MSQLTDRDLDRLLKLRVIVARFGEMDLAGWWNTNGQLGRLGTATLRRGLPRTHSFAQARSVFAVAKHRCHEYYDAPRSATLWDLPQNIEQAFDARWETWLSAADVWTSFFGNVEQLDDTDLASALLAAELATQREIAKAARLTLTAEGRAVQVPGTFDGSIDDIARLALAFAHGSKGALAVPYQAMSA